MQRAENLRVHGVILCQPHLRPLVPAPVTRVELRGRKVLFDIARTRVEDEEQSLLVEATDLVLDRLHIVHAITVGSDELGNGRSRRHVIPQRVDLL